MSKKFILLQFLMLMACCHFMNAQKPDSLKSRTFDYLQEAIDKNEGDSILTRLYLGAFLEKAKAEKNWGKIADGYRNMIYAADDGIKIAYADSMLHAAAKTADDETIGAAYLSKGVVYYSQKKYNHALDYFIKANDYIYRTNNDYLKYKTKYSIANIKFYLGFYDEAVVLLKECVHYFNQSDYNNSKGYFTSLHALGLCYNKTGDLDLCSATNEKGIAESKKRNYPEEAIYFIHSEGINQYSKKNYAAAIEKLTSVLPAIKKNEDFANETLSYFYLGKSYMALGDPEKSLTYFKKVDRAIGEKDYIRPDLRENFEILINYYREKDDLHAQLHYINRLIKADSILNLNYKYLSNKIHKEYDTRALLRAKNEMERKLVYKEHLSSILYGAIVVLFVLVMFLLYRYYTHQRNYREKFEMLMQKQEQHETPAESAQETVLQETKKPDINPEVIAAVIKQLEKFEAHKKFLQKELTLVGLAANFGTNANYLSRIINFYRNKNYITYINDLRIDYIVQRIKDESRYRNYTIKALAEEAGFSTPQHFSKAFYARTGIYPSYFINELSREYNAYSIV